MKLHLNTTLIAAGAVVASIAIATCAFAPAMTYLPAASPTSHEDGYLPPPPPLQAQVEKWGQGFADGTVPVTTTTPTSLIPEPGSTATITQLAESFPSCWRFMLNLSWPNVPSSDGVAQIGASVADQVSVSIRYDRPGEPDLRYYVGSATCQG